MEILWQRCLEAPLQTSPTYGTPDTDAFTIACTSDDFVFAFRVAFLQISRWLGEPIPLTCMVNFGTEISQQLG